MSKCQQLLHMTKPENYTRLQMFTNFLSIANKTTENLPSTSKFTSCNALPNLFNMTEAKSVSHVELLGDTVEIFEIKSVSFPTDL